MDYLHPIELPPGNEIKDYTPVAEFATAKEASSAAHSLVRDRKVSVSWQEFKDSVRILGYAVYVLTTQLRTFDIGGEG